MNVMIVFFSIGLVISAIYFLIIILINIGIFRLNRFTPAPAHQFTSSPVHPFTTVSVLIPARNEEENISYVLEDLAGQNYPGRLLEIVVIDDQSTDQTQSRVREFMISHPAMNLRIIPMVHDGPHQAFKKQAILTGVQATHGDLILTTDADTRLRPGWVSLLAAFYEDRHPKMIIAPVAFQNEDTFFKRLQSMEFSGLMAATAGSCAMGFPLMCNGANLAFERSAYTETQDSSDLRYPSGDDLFLMMKIRKKYGAKTIKYLLTAKAIVSTNAKMSLPEFFSQRLRWVSKSRGYTDPAVTGVAVVTWLFNFLMLSALITGIFNMQLLLLSLVLFGMKMVLEFPAVTRILALSGKMKLWYFYPLAQVLNLFYVSLIGILGNLVSYEWKGRKINPL